MDVNAVDVGAWLDATDLVVVVGAGGVGKTTTAASVGLQAALRGRKVVVLTIDPARRLANSLGLAEFGNEARKIDLTSLDGAEGELWAMMLDSRSTFDDLIRRIAPNEAARDRILSNHIYRHMADTFAGSQDYMATESLYNLVSSGDYDLVVLDTPPVKNALDFLESPGRLLNFLDEKVLSWFLVSDGSGDKVSRGWVLNTQAVVYRLLGLVFGSDFLDDLAAFFEDFKGLYAGFVERHEAVLALFEDPKTQFLTVCAPTEASLDIAVFFQEELTARSLHRGGVIVNQMHRCTGEAHDAAAVLSEEVTRLSAGADPAVPASILARLGMAHRRLHQRSSVETALVKRVQEAAKGSLFYQEIPRLDANVHTLSALHEVGAYLLAPAQPSTPS